MAGQIHGRPYFIHNIHLRTTFIDYFLYSIFKKNSSKKLLISQCVCFFRGFIHLFESKIIKQFHLLMKLIYLPIIAYYFIDILPHTPVSIPCINAK